MTEHTVGRYFSVYDPNIKVRGPTHVIGVSPDNNDTGTPIAFVPAWTVDEKARREAEANLRLLMAAPQMLTALKAAWFAIDPDTHPDQNRMVRAAIDAAEGKS